MAQHFLLSAAARSLSPGKVMRMSERGAENVFVRLRWPQTDGKPICPHCGCQTCYDCRRSEHQSRWRCKACRADFSATSGTLFAWHKLPLRTYLMAIAVFCNEVKGKRPHVRFRRGETGKGRKAKALPWTRQGHSPWNQSGGACSIGLNSLRRMTLWPP
jgi:Transposase zinc-ribbon domain